MSDDVRTLTGQVPLSVQEFLRKNAAAFTVEAKQKRLREHKTLGKEQSEEDAKDFAVV